MPGGHSGDLRMLWERPVPKKRACVGPPYLGAGATFW